VTRKFVAYRFVIPDPPQGGGDPVSMLNVNMDPGVRQDDDMHRICETAR